MRRKLFNLAMALSVSLVCAVTVLWVRSYWTSDTFSGETPFRWMVSSNRGRIVASRYDPPTVVLQGITRPPTAQPRYAQTAAHRDPIYDASDPGITSKLGLAGFEWLASDGGVATPTPTRVKLFGRKIVLAVPYWFAVLVFAIGPLAYLVRRRRTLPGLCSTCGYDLRASPERCPECGTVPEPALRTAA